MPRVVHFEITAEDPDRAAGFYSQVFGWELTKWEGPMEYWLITTGKLSAQRLRSSIPVTITAGIMCSACL